MIKSLLAGFILICAGSVSQGSLLLEVDISNPAALRITSTGLFADADYTGGTVTFPVRLLNFFTADPGQEQGLAAITSNLLPSSGTASALDSLLAGRAIPGQTTLVLRNGFSSAAGYSTSSAGFTGEAVFDLTSLENQNYIDYLPVWGTTGNIVADNGVTVVGTYSVVPEPSTYGLIFGVACMAIAEFKRRKATALLKAGRF